jgi:hypothetical protein
LWGEAVFRRIERNRRKCHAANGPAGGFGPEMSALGLGSPIDDVVNSIPVPDQAIEDEFQARVVLIDDGRVFQGIVAEEDEKRLILGDATVELDEGTHKLTLRVEVSARESLPIRVEAVRPEGSSVEFCVVDGRYTHSLSCRGADIREGADDLVEIIADEQLVVLEVAKPDVVIAKRLGEQGIEVGQSNRHGGSVELLDGFIVGVGEQAKSGCGHADLLLRADLRGTSLTKEVRPRALTTDA